MLTTRSSGAAHLAFVGCFTTATRKARGRGIEVYRIDPGSGAWQLTDRVSDLVNPSFLISDPARQMLYSAHGDSDFATAFAIDAVNGKLRLLGKAATGGMNGVHPALDPSGRNLVVANYASGSLAVLPIHPDGTLGDFSHLLDLPGEIGPHRTEQPCAHPHQVVFAPSGRFLMVPDKGLDRVFVLALDAERGTLSIKSQAVMRPGAGPRHMVFHPSLAFAFVANELDSTVATCRWDDAEGVLRPVRVISTLPADFFGASTCAAIVITPDGKHVYVSNRGQDGIARFDFIAAEARLELVGWTPANGRDPRFMTLDPSGENLLVAAEQGDVISALRISKADGTLTLNGVALPVASPCTIAFL